MALFKTIKRVDEGVKGQRKIKDIFVIIIQMVALSEIVVHTWSPKMYQKSKKIVQIRHIFI